MRVAALYDVHGNLPALEAVLADPRCAAADVIVGGGDLLSGPMPAQALDRLLAFADRVVFLRGNADRQVIESYDERSSWCRSRLGRTRCELVSGWPLPCTLDVDGLGQTLFCHATARSDEEIVTRITPGDAVGDGFAGRSGLAVVGHTDVQFDRSVGDLRLVSAGSVGMPYEGRPGAFWALLGTPCGSEPQGAAVELTETAYDSQAAAAAIRATGAPMADELAAVLLSPPSPDEATATFEGQRGA